MRSWLLGIAIAASAFGCGRVSFSTTPSSEDAGGRMDGGSLDAALPDAATMDSGSDVIDAGARDAGDSGDVDGATSGVLDPMLITKVSVAAPLFASPLPTSGDCGQWATFFVHDEPIDDNDLMPDFFLDPDGHTLWSVIPCKPNDVGWSLGLGRWDTTGGTFDQLDGDPTNLGRNAFVSVDELYSDGRRVVSTRAPGFAFGPDGTLHGMAAYFDGAIFDDVVPIEAATPDALDALSYLPAIRHTFLPAAAPWVTRTALRRYVLLVGTTFYIYSVHWDGSSMTPLGLPNTSIGVSTSTDLRSSTFVASPLVTGWTEPYVSESGGHFHMVARNLATNAWSYIRGTSPVDFDFAGAVPLRLYRFAGAPGAWDEQRFVTHGTSGDPQVTGAVVIGGTLYILYLAGVPPNGSFASASTDGKGGIGLLSVPVPP